MKLSTVIIDGKGKPMLVLGGDAGKRDARRFRPSSVGR